MNEMPKALDSLSENKKAIIRVILVNPDSLIDFRWLKLELCGPGGMSDRRLRSNLEAIVSDGILDKVRSASGMVFYGLTYAANDPLIRGTALRHRGKKSSRGEHLGTIVTKRRTVSLTPEERIDWLKKAKEEPVYRPPGRSEKARRAQMKNYLTMIDWQIDECKQEIEKSKLDARKKEIEDKYRRPRDTEEGS